MPVTRVFEGLPSCALLEGDAGPVGEEPVEALPKLGVTSGVAVCAPGDALSGGEGVGLPDAEAQLVSVAALALTDAENKFDADAKPVAHALVLKNDAEAL